MITGKTMKIKDKVRDSSVYIAINFVFFRAVYMPSTPSVGNVNRGNGENILMASSKFGFLRRSAITPADKKSVNEKQRPNNRNSLLTPFISDFCSPALRRGIK